MTSAADIAPPQDQTTPEDAFATHLIETNTLTISDLKRAQKIKRETGDPLGATLTNIGLISENDLAEAYAAHLSIDRVTLDDLLEGAQISESLSAAFLQASRVIPLTQEEDKLTLALADPLDDFAVDAMAFFSGKKITKCVATKGDIESALDQVCATQSSSMADIYGEIDGPGSAGMDDDLERIRDLASEAPIIRLVNMIIGQAMDARASDIHIEPLEGRLRVRFRIDGVLRDVEAPPREASAAMISRVKIMAQLNIAERRLPQDGRIRIALQGRSIDIRVSTSPTSFGESVVLRLLDQTSLKLDFGTLGFDEKDETTIKHILARPHGILLVTGPTGSGKTTTLYAALNELNKAERKILTIEDPVEYRLDGINQSQVHPQIGLTFAAALRSFLRQDPDVMMVGEIRDLETAETAVRAALTGHLILSTLHTNDAASGITRLLDMGVDDYLIGSTVIGIQAQRLVRRLCAKCRIPYTPDPLTLEKLGMETQGDDGYAFYRPGGCDHCGASGFYGRIAVMEILEITDTIRKFIMAHGETANIRKAAIEGGMRPMLTDGIAKAGAGLTTLEEVWSVTKGA